MVSSTLQKFHWADYLLFALSFAVTIIVGIVFAVKNKWHQQSSQSYLLADRKLNWFPISISIMASIMSAVMFVGFTTEFYYNGLEFIWALPGLVVGILFPIFFVIPKLLNMKFQMTSGYEYLEYRFGLPVRMACGLVYSVFTLLYMAVMLYVPSLVLAQVADINIYTALAIGGLVCLVYTGFGGMKAVVWVDNIQILIIAIGFIVLAVKGTLDAGGISHVVWRYKEAHRANALDIDAEPWDRHTVWNLVFLFGLNMMGYFGTHQMILQRYLALRTLRSAQGAAVIAIVSILVLATLVLIIAMSAYATLGGNEPFLLKETTKPDQILPYYLMKVMGVAHGVPGLVVAALFAAALSSLSSGQNALAAILLEDFIKPVYRLRQKELTSKVAGWISRSTGVLWGILTLAIAMAVPSMDDMVFSMARSFEGVVSGPLLGVFICAFFLGYIESWGIFCGLVVALVWHLFLYPTSLRRSQKLGFDRPPMYLNNFTEEVLMPSPTGTATLFDVSYTWYVLMDVVIVIVIATVISIFVHIIKICCRKGRCSNVCVDKEYRYNKHDFLVAIGVRKWFSRVQEKDDSIGLDQPEKDGSIKKDEIMGYINEASFHTRF